MPNARTIATALVLLQLIGGCAGGTSSAPRLPSAPESIGSAAGTPSVSAAAVTTSSPTPTQIAGGCGSTAIFAPPGPTSNPGLDHNPWALAEPPSAGLFAYFWGQPPYLAASRTRPHGESNKILWVGGGGATLAISARPPGATGPVVTLEFPASGGEYPSTIDLPSPGCWHLDLATSGGAVASIDLFVAPAVAAISPAPSIPTPSTAAVSERPTPPPTCAITVPATPFVPPPPFAPQPPAAYGTRWYGSAQLWTELDRGGDVWWALPHNTAGYAQKTFWWAVGYSASSEPQPAIVVTGRQLDGAGTFRAGDPGTNAIFDGTESMLVGVDVPTAGCWMITGSYRGARLSYVVWVSSG